MRQALVECGPGIVGLYATAAQLGLLPLVPGVAESAAAVLADGHMPHIFGVSGYSGAGTGTSEKNDRDVLRHNLLPYALTGHIHEREVSHQLGTPCHFSPHVAAFFQGINLTICAKLREPVEADAVREQYTRFYADEPLVRVHEGTPYVRDNVGEHHVTVGGFTVDAPSSRVVVVSTIDNLLKGAATQALQNINIALGLPELAGLDEHDA